MEGCEGLGTINSETVNRLPARIQRDTELTKTEPLLQRESHSRCSFPLEQRSANCKSVSSLLVTCFGQYSFLGTLRSFIYILWLETMQTYSLRVLEVRSSTSVTLKQSQSANRVGLLFGGSRGKSILLLYFSFQWLPVSFDL